MKNALLILLAVSCVALAQVGVNLVKNPGFEELDENGYPAHWRQCPSTFKSSTENCYSGARSIQWYNTTPGKYEFVVQALPVQPGKTYEFSIYAKQVDRPEAAGSGIKTSVNCFMEFTCDGRFLGGSYYPAVVPLNSDWVKLVGRAVIPEKATTVTFGFRAVPDGTNLTQIWFDDCAVVEVQDDFLDDCCITDQYRDTATGGQVAILQGMSPGLRSTLEAGKASLRMELIDNAGKPVMALAPNSLDDRCATFAFDADTLPAGAYTLRGSYADAEGRETFTSQGTFTKVEKLPEYRTYVDGHRRLIVDGKPFLPLGMYFRDLTRENLRPYLGTKFNCVMPYAPPADAAMLDFLQENALKLIYSIKDNAHSPNGEDATAKLQAAGIDRLDQWKHHPAILMWYINDELGKEHVNDAFRYQRQCEEHDPSRPTWSVLNVPANFRYYVSTSDILGSDPYPIPEAFASRAYEWTAKMDKAVMGAKMLIQVPQVFCWGRYWAKYGRSPEECARCRRPTFREMDAMSWMCIAGGANGLVYYSYFDMQDRAKATDTLPAIPFDEHFGECKAIAERIMAHEQVLLSAGTPLNYTVAENDGDEVVFRAYELDGVTWLLAVNTSDEKPRSFRLEMERPLTLKGTSLSAPPVDVEGTQVHATLDTLEAVFLQLQ